MTRSTWLLFKIIYTLVNNTKFNKDLSQLWNKDHTDSLIQICCSLIHFIYCIPISVLSNLKKHSNNRSWQTRWQMRIIWHPFFTLLGNSHALHPLLETWTIELDSGLSEMIQAEVNVAHACLQGNSETSQEWSDRSKAGCWMIPKALIYCLCRQQSSSVKATRPRVALASWNKPLSSRTTQHWSHIGESRQEQDKSESHGNVWTHATSAVVFHSDVLMRTTGETGRLH